MSGARNPDIDAWIDEARSANVYDVLCRIRPAHGLKKTSAEFVGPCPSCGGTDRFAIHRRRNVWLCRKAQQGGDAIALVEYLDGADFFGAVETITGRPAPDGSSGRTVDAEFVERQRAEAEARRIQAERELNDFRAKEIRRAYEIWNNGGRWPGSMVEAYLRYRGVSLAPDAKIRALSLLPYWHKIGDEWRIVHQGPAMVAAIQGRDGSFIGCHCTWIDPDLKTRSGKASIVHPDTGEVLDAKKVRGSQKGGHIHLAGDRRASRLILGEGIETVLSVREACMVDEDQRSIPSLYWAAVNLGNIGGRAKEAVVHPTLTRTDKNGRIRRAKVPGPVPDLDDLDCLEPPDGMLEVLLLGDGDSDRFTTANVLQRFAARWAGSRVAYVRAAWPGDGLDFNDLLRGGQHD